MKIDEPSQRLTIYLGENDQWQDKPLYHVIVLKAKELGLAGATVYRGVEGFGANSRIHTTRILTLSSDLPLVIEIVDSEQQIQQLLPFVKRVVREGLITLEEVRVVKYVNSSS